MHRIAAISGSIRSHVIRRNLVPARRFPYRTATGALLIPETIGEAINKVAEGGLLADLVARRDRARAEGRLYGIGYTAVVEPSVSNMGYITTVLMRSRAPQGRPEERRPGDAPRSASIRSAASRCTWRRCRRGRAIAPCCRRWWRTCSACRPATSASTPRSTRPRTPGRSRPATTPAARAGGRRNGQARRRASRRAAGAHRCKPAQYRC